MIASMYQTHCACASWGSRGPTVGELQTRLELCRSGEVIDMYVVGGGRSVSKKLLSLGFAANLTLPTRAKRRCASAAGIDSQRIKDPVRSSTLALRRCPSRWIRVGQGSLTAGAAPSARKLEALARSMGVNHVVTLLREKETLFRVVRDTCRELRLGWTHVPLSGAHVAQRNDVAALARLEDVLRSLEAGDGVFVHCAAGLHRTGIACYIILRLAGWSVDDTLHGLKSMREVAHAELICDRRKKQRCQDRAETLVQALLARQNEIP
eukprot:TRINITY_DN33561_c0_g1_i1.p1 TRINITY_DN33561_c0_g1~~TRINITY_DN33561_c0_g1_i1.p1  ORF type:complete len:276 (+),score=27.56 TRINITY_DN33561_c0_g1_i1:33-830(+)